MNALVLPLPVRCTHCKQDKPLSAFGKNPRKRNGLLSWCKECTQGNHKRWRTANPEGWARRTTEYAYNLKLQVFAKFGNRCNNPACLVPGGCTDVRCLQVDHVHNDGNLERRYGSGGRGRVAILRRALLDTEGRYQLLCANCNTSKAWDNNQARLRAASRRAK